jgi:hypothetical protein
MELNRAIINAYTGEGWYVDGQKRLVASLDGVDADVFAWNEADLQDSIYYDKGCPYTIKAAAFDKAIKLGYEQIIWMDCSVQVVKDLTDWFKLIDNDGYYFMMGGWNCAQECNDYSLTYFGFTRDQAELMPSLWSCIFAIDLRFDKPRQVMQEFLESCKLGVFHGSRHHDGQSQDARFLHHRQDQSALSLAFHRAEISKIHIPQAHMAYTGMGAEVKDTTLFTVQGGI